MKNKCTRIALVLGFTALVLLSACSLSGYKSPEATLEAYFADANSQNYSNMYTYLHPDNNHRNAFKAGNESFGTIYENGSVSYSISSSSGDTYTVSVTYSISGSNTETFIFENDGTNVSPNYLILSFTATGDTYD